jgi:hypothetical protein
MNTELVSSFTASIREVFSKAIQIISGNHRNWLLVLGWLILQLYLYRSFGVKTHDDSVRYLEYGENIAKAGYFESGHNKRYLGYCLFVALVIWAGGSLKALIATQVLISGLAAVILYKTTWRLSGSIAAAVLATWLFILWPDVQYWNYNILTESLFTSFLIFSFAVIVLSQRWWHWIIAVFILLFTALIRPNGFIMVIAAIVYGLAYFGQWLHKQNPKWVKVTFAALFALTLLVTYWLLDRYLLTTFGILGVYENGWVIFGWDGFTILPETPLYIPDVQLPPIKRMLMAIEKNLLYFLKIFLVKVGMYIGYIKPYYSTFHNSVIVAFIYPLYFLAGKAMLKKELALPARLCIYTIILLHVVMVGLTFEDWDCRFLIPLLPFIFMASSIGLTRYFRQIFPVAVSREVKS